MATAFIGLGSNLSDPVKQLNLAISYINRLPDTSVVRTSQFYGSTPLGPSDQPDFVNAVCLIETAFTPLALLSALQTIESEQGRVKKRHWGERLIDLDILLFDGLELASDVLTIPHKELTSRDFVLIPLLEIAPDLAIPNKGSVKSLIATLQTSYLYPLSSDS
ncbi:MAG: 2-amino-4-hydroxy-6-hydroxymethyldihydropteridine diphosphokinase [Thiomicrorhabdus sp.]|nr:2-amino-4-hydroxy-6-hydroxymethyldihydropteridine diphosphokinase [Thiomicrorhabdus sp.]